MSHNQGGESLNASDGKVKVFEVWLDAWITVLVMARSADDASAGFFAPDRAEPLSAYPVTDARLIALVRGGHGGRMLSATGDATLEALALEAFNRVEAKEAREAALRRVLTGLNAEVVEFKANNPRPAPSVTFGSSPPRTGTLELVVVEPDPDPEMVL